MMPPCIRRQTDGVPGSEAGAGVAACPGEAVYAAVSFGCRPPGDRLADSPPGSPALRTRVLCPCLSP